MGLFKCTPPRTGVINRLDHRGHGPIAEWTKDDRLSEDDARKVFTEHQERHFTMFDISNGDGVVMKAFDPTVTEVLAVPRMQAG